MRIGYARTSTIEQDAGLEAQVRDLEASGCGRIYREKVSGTKIDRPQLQAALDHLRDGDTLVITKPDRMARSTADLLAFVEKVKAKGAALVILTMGGQTLDTNNPTSKLMLTMLAAVAEFERELMLERQREGIAKAQAEGRYKGRPRSAMTKADEVHALKAQGVGPSEIARRLGMGRASVYRALESA